MLRFEYDRVVAHHPYRTDEPWKVEGATRILQVDGWNGLSDQERRLVADELRALEKCLLDEATSAGIKAWYDNHHGYTVRVDGRTLEGGKYVPDMYYHLRFSDGSLYVWLMPGPPSKGEWSDVP